MPKTPIEYSLCGTPAFDNLALGSGVCILDVFYRFLFWFFSNVHSLILAEDNFEGTYEISYCKMMQRHSAVLLHHANQKFIGAAQGVFTV